MTMDLIKGRPYCSPSKSSLESINIFGQMIHLFFFLINIRCTYINICCFTYDRVPADIFGISPILSYPAQPWLAKDLDMENSVKANV